MTIYSAPLIRPFKTTKANTQSSKADTKLISGEEEAMGRVVNKLDVDSGQKGVQTEILESAVTRKPR
jgi:hypothetical protein